MNKFTKIYFLFLLFLLIFFTSGVVDSQDGLTYLGVARNIYYKGEPTAPIYEYDTRENIHLSTYVGKNGKTYATTGLGYSIAYLPSVFITDLVYKFYNISPPVHFPLESDWLFLLLASFTNAFFGALLGVTTYKYLKLLNLDHKKSLILSLIGIFSTNLWIYTKHSFAHMMFVTFLLLSFYFLKKYSLEKKRKLLLFSGIFYGIVIITYNFSFTLTIIPYFSYYLILNNFKIGNFQLAKRAKDLIHIFIGMLPSLIIFFWFENLRSRPTTEQTLTLINSFKNLVWGIPKSLFFEGVFGQLFSPGKSIFLFSPITLLPIIFWHKYKKLNPESITFISLSLLYIIAHALHYKYGGLTRGYRTFWYGESSWGPRYLLPIVPFGIIIFGHIINNIKRKELMWVFIPIISIGFYVNLLGIIFPYQIKTHNNESKFYVNSNEFTVYDYVNIIPRYSPLISMTKNLVKLPSNFIHTINNGNYNVKFYDGIDFAFNVGPERWRSIEKDGYISFDNKENNPIKNISFTLINHPISEFASSSAILTFTLNDQTINKDQKINVGNTEYINLPINESVIKTNGNDLKISFEWTNDKNDDETSQLLAIKKMEINGENINLESIDVPYISDLGRVMGYKYNNWGGTNKDLWKTWHIHTQVYERIPDFWWLRSFYYWDIPNIPFIILIILDILLIIYYFKKIVKDTSN